MICTHPSNMYSSDNIQISPPHLFKNKQAVSWNTSMTANVQKINLPPADEA